MGCTKLFSWVVNHHHNSVIFPYLVEARGVCGGRPGVGQHGELVLVLARHPELGGQAVAAVALQSQQGGETGECVVNKE